MSSDNLASLKAIKAVRTTSPLSLKCQKALNYISIRHAVAHFCVPGHAAIRGNEITDGLSRGGTALTFLGPKPALGVCRGDLQKRLIRCLVKLHGAQWRDLGDTERLDPSVYLGTQSGHQGKMFDFNRIKPSVVNDLLMVITP